MRSIKGRDAGDSDAPATSSVSAPQVFAADFDFIPAFAGAKPNGLAPFSGMRETKHRQSPETAAAGEDAASVIACVWVWLKRLIAPLCPAYSYSAGGVGWTPGGLRSRLWKKARLSARSALVLAHRTFSGPKYRLSRLIMVSQLRASHSVGVNGSSSANLISSC